jgi:CheY-like chemotaxis protein
MSMNSSLVVCEDCGASSAAVEWGFVLLARHGWTARLGDTGTEAQWRCPACNERLAVADTWDDKMNEPASQRRLRVLLIDDQVMVLRATASMLRELDVVTASSGAEALEKLAAGSHFDVVVSDVSMPGLNGPELYVKIRQLYPYLAGRFLLLSGDGYGAGLLCAAVARREGLAGMPRVLDKPVPRDELVRAIDELGQRHLPRSGTFVVADPTASPVQKTK